MGEGQLADRSNERASCVQVSVLCAATIHEPKFVRALTSPRTFKRPSRSTRPPFSSPRDNNSASAKESLTTRSAVVVGPPANSSATPFLTTNVMADGRSRGESANSNFTHTDSSPSVSAAAAPRSLALIDDNQAVERNSSTDYGAGCTAASLALRFDLRRIFRPSQPAGSKEASTTRSFMGMIALSVM
jgi:hypothetical protein